LTATLLPSLAIPLAGCIVEGPGRPGWRANHPYRCGFDPYGPPALQMNQRLPDNVLMLMPAERI
jgi:hypothetical protein